MFPIPINREACRITGTYIDWLDDERRWVVDGIYEVSTISVPPRGRHETVGFKQSGTGPDHLQEPTFQSTLHCVVL